MADEITRKHFLQAGAATLVAVSFGACAADDGEGEDGADSGDCDGGATANIATNHSNPHTMDVAAGDIAAGAAKDYDIAGSAGHSHTVSLTAEDMAALADGESVNVTSSSDGTHTHAVTVTC